TRMRLLPSTRAGLCSACSGSKKPSLAGGFVVWPNSEAVSASDASVTQASARGADVLYALDVRGLEAFRALGEVELHCLALIQAPVSVLLDSREMHEHILARGPLDESVPFGSVKPLDCTFLSHLSHNLLLSPGLLAITPAPRTFPAQP